MLVALAAVIIGPISGMRLARRQIVSPIRQKWIDDLRDLISTLLSRCRSAIIMTEGHGVLDKHKPNEQLLNEVLFLEQKLQLMLNPHERNHEELLALVSQIVDSVQHGVPNLHEFGGQLKNASSTSKAILKREWERVKHGES